jgi:delta24-sterol reductase
MAPHEEVVAHVSATVKAFFSRKQSFRIFHGSTNSTRPAHDGRIVDISALSNVLKVDRKSSTATVEPNVSMDKLVQATLAHGMIPPVVMEFPGITVGGGYAGSAGESSSFKYGYFDQTVCSVEMVLATGEVITASESENADIFKGAAGALGSLGITTKLELRLIPAKRFVKLIYHPYSTSHETIKALRQATENPDNDYVDGIMFSNNHGVLMTGQLTDDIPPSESPQTFSGPWDPWFYLHAMEKPLGKQSTDYIPIAEYLFRYDRGGFWVGTHAFKYFGFVPFNRFTRWLLNDFMHTRMMYRALHGSNMSFGTMIHDLSLPYDTVEEFIDYTTQKLGIWPLWLCPLRAVDPPTFHPCTTGSKQGGFPQPMLNIGLWGAASKDIDTFIHQNRHLEARLTELGGRKVLYSHTYYTEEEFWELYDQRWYETLRKRYSATTLPTVYDKVKVDVTQQMQTQNLPWIRRLGSLWPFPGLMGIRCAIRSKDYLMHRQLSWMRWKSGETEVREEGVNH